METPTASWVRDIASRPIAFAQVREDSTLDHWVIEQLAAGARVLMVASGGCTAALLATTPQVSLLHLVDPNRAQIALARLKLRLLTTAGTLERLSILGHASMPLQDRRSRLIRELQALNLPVDTLGPIELVAELGPDHAGRYEGLFAKLRETFFSVADEITALLRLR